MYYWYIYYLYILEESDVNAVAEVDLMFLPAPKRGWRVRCELCGREAEEISKTLRVCPTCVRERFDDARPYIEEAHAKVRRRYGCQKNHRGPRTGGAAPAAAMPALSHRAG